MKSGELAADAIIEGLEKNDVSASQLGKWTSDFSAGVVWIRKLVHAFYTNEFSFGKFMKEHPEQKSNLTDLLIGRVFSGSAGEIFRHMDPAIDQVSSDSSQPGQNRQHA